MQIFKHSRKFSCLGLLRCNHKRRFADGLLRDSRFYHVDEDAGVRLSATTAWTGRLEMIIIILWIGIQPYRELICLQFVRVMQHMASDLGFFGIVWGILVLAFSTAMLGAGLRHGASYETEGSALFVDNTKPQEPSSKLENVCSTSNSGQPDSDEPWKRWAVWWFVRTYLQSLGQVFFHVELVRSGFWCLT